MARKTEKIWIIKIEGGVKWIESTLYHEMEIYLASVSFTVGNTVANGVEESNNINYSNF